MSLSPPHHSREGGNPEQLITEHLDIWTSAIQPKASAGRGSSKKYELYGIKKLRELILELAVRGLLVPQDPKDEPASELIKKIDAEKARLLKEGKIKKEKPPLPIKDEDKPFGMPQGWVWVRLSSLCELENGDRSKNYPNKSLLVDSGIPFVNAGHIQNGRINSSVMTFISEERFNLLSGGKFSDGDILFCLRGSLGKSAIVEGFPRGAIASSLVIVRLIGDADRLYFHNFFDSPLSYKQIQKYDNGTAQPNLSAADLGKFLIPVPPLPEQHRIVAKVHELMALCDQLEQQTEANHDAHQTLVETLLNALLDAAQSRDDASVFEQAWQRIAEHFDVLFTTEHSIDQLKQTILQLAVMGKLVPQDPNDEPASVLLEKIAAEKARLVKEGKIKKQEKLPPIRDDEKPFELPQGWEWARLNDIVSIRGGKRTSNGYKLMTAPTPYIYIRVKDMKDGTIDDTDLHYIDAAMREKIKQYIISKDDIYMTIVGATIGKCGLVPEKFDNMNLTENAARLTPSSLVHREFIYDCLRSEFCQNQFIDKTNQVGVQKMALIRLASTLIPVPPASEQKRVSSKLELLMNYSDSLKDSIYESQNTQLSLAGVIADQAFN